jgi:hypothetical protein
LKKAAGFRHAAFAFQSRNRAIDKSRNLYFAATFSLCASTFTF